MGPSRAHRRLWLGTVLPVVGAVPGRTAPCDQWQLINPVPVERDLLGATTGNRLFVVVGRQGTVLISPDEVAWRMVEAPTTGDLHAAV
jgi:hypothetical protein